MSEQGRMILAQALKLPPIERAELIERILDSFGLADRKEVDEAWAREAEDRIDGYEQGKMKSVEISDLFGRIDSQNS